ncbi:hypothetical protein CDL15_Pgr000369 [Punica granatum]|uniref:Uncharacterized protein n=1 Tax=Punica granatum TaxID=22663 RepID=A0A218XUL3_PUNGR|nr:hypothetical protein CDL15_Pgr000369 [Punica granatum]
MAKFLSNWENFANRSPIGTAPENREISAIPTVPATGEAQIGTGVPRAALRTLTRFPSRRRCGAQRPEPPLSAARRRPCYRPIATNGLRPIAFHCRSSPSAQPAQPVSRGPTPFAAQAQSDPKSSPAQDLSGRFPPLDRLTDRPTDPTRPDPTGNFLILQKRPQTFGLCKIST